MSLSRRTPLRSVPLAPGPVTFGRRVPLRAASSTLTRSQGFRPAGTRRAREGSAQKPSATRTPVSGSRESFPPAIAALIDARDAWCIHCGTPRGLQRHHRRIKGFGGDPRPHTDCACNGVRICATCHDWAHSGDGRREAEAEGLIIPRVTAAPWTLPVLVHLEEDAGGQRKFPSCDGRWLDYMPGSEAA